MTDHYSDLREKEYEENKDYHDSLYLMKCVSEYRKEVNRLKQIERGRKFLDSGLTEKEFLQIERNESHNH